MKYIITETQNKRLAFLRRFSQFEKHLNKTVKNDYPCNYEDADDYANILIEDAVLAVFGKDWDEYEYLDDFEFMNKIKEKYYQKLVDKYNKEDC
jgi:hypothetical protein